MVAVLQAQPIQPAWYDPAHLRRFCQQVRGLDGDETIDPPLGDVTLRGKAAGASSVALAQRAREGDREALDSLLERYLPSLRRWATGRLPRWAREHLDTDDLIQETLVKTLRNLDGFTPRHDGAFAAYLRHGLLNRIRDEVRNAARRPGRAPLPDAQADPGASPLEAAIGAEALALYESALERLTEDERALVVARMELGLAYEAIARETGKPSPDAARMGVRRALLRLAEEMRHG
jgi:RNA polymerase sigma-70 factor (ECF subfamily)